MTLRLGRAALLGILLSSLIGPPAGACSVCFSGKLVTIREQLDAAAQAVLALPIANGTQFRIVDVVKGDSPVNGIIPEPVLGADAAAIQSGKPLLVTRPLLLLRNDPGQLWASVGMIGVEYAGWLRQLAAGSLQSELTDADWRSRVALVVSYLENPEPLAAEVAYGEIARAPYRALRSLKPQLDPVTLSQWIDSPRLASRRSPYTLLLGIAGGPKDAERLEQRIEVAWKSRDATNLAAMLAADLELRGQSRVGWIEKKYFADRSRTMPEIEAALLALEVHGDTDAVVPRSRVIQAYRLFMRERKPMAGFVAKELAEWNYWDATPEYVALLRSNAVEDPGSRYAILVYLQRSPRADAKAALKSMAAVATP